MANLLVQLRKGLNQAVSLAAATAGGDSTDLNPGVGVMVQVGGTATTVTVTPVGPYVGDATPKVYVMPLNATTPVPTWDQKGRRGNFKMGRADFTYSQVVGVNVGAFTNEGA